MDERPRRTYFRNEPFSCGLTDSDVLRREPTRRHALARYANPRPSPLNLRNPDHAFASAPQVGPEGEDRPVDGGAHPIPPGGHPIP
jgi:hypothetical protein